MSVLYSFVQADTEEDAQDLISYFAQEGILPSPDFKPGRTPTYAELRQAFDKTDGYKIEYDVTDQHWDVWFESPDGIRTWLAGRWKEGSVRDENSTANFFWKGGTEEMIPVAEKLADICGVITMVSGSDPNNFTFVFPTTSK
jgi:hypothetical protein